MINVSSKNLEKIEESLYKGHGEVFKFNTPPFCYVRSIAGHTTCSLCRCRATAVRVRIFMGNA